MNSKSMAPAEPQTQASAPWWKFPHVWMVVLGPVLVIVAGCFTFWLAARNPDAVIAEDYYRRGLEINKSLEGADSSLVPAMKGRNHAATPDKDQPR